MKVVWPNDHRCLLWVYFIVPILYIQSMVQMIRCKQLYHQMWLSIMICFELYNYVTLLTFLIFPHLNAMYSMFRGMYVVKKYIFVSLENRYKPPSTT